MWAPLMPTWVRRPPPSDAADAGGLEEREAFVRLKYQRKDFCRMAAAALGVPEPPRPTRPLPTLAKGHGARPKLNEQAHQLAEELGAVGDAGVCVEGDEDDAEEPAEPSVAHAESANSPRTPARRRWRLGRLVTSVVSSPRRRAAAAERSRAFALSDEQALAFKLHA